MSANVITNDLWPDCPKAPQSSARYSPAAAMMAKSSSNSMAQTLRAPLESRQQRQIERRLADGWGVSQQEWQVAGDSRPAFGASYRLAQPSSTGIHRGPPAWRAPMDASRRRQVECPPADQPKKLFG